VPRYTETAVVPGLATIAFDTRPNDHPAVEIILADEYEGDLNDLEKANGLPARVLFAGTHATSINDPKLARFMEVLHHWDHNRDGAYDADVVSDKIEQALWESRDSTEVFRRLQDGLYTRLLLRLMPPQPERHIVLGYGELKPRFKLRHYALGVVLLFVVFSLVTAQINAMPAMRHSVVSGWGLLVDKIGLIPAWLLLVLFIIINRRLGKSKAKGKSLSKHTYGFFNKAAVYEEQAFREGAENWTFAQRATSCFVFGAIHMVNLIYPLASILPLTLGGALFMYVYLHNYRQTHFRRSAVLAASVVHRVYNRIALIVILLIVLTSLTSVVIGGLTFIAALLLLKLLATAATIVRGTNQLQEATAR
jgi:hypothetical protein